jgi:hypothetical protein
MSAFNPSPEFDFYYKACRKGDREAKAVAVSYSPVGVLADASEVTDLPRDNFEAHESQLSEGQFRFVRPNIDCSRPFVSGRRSRNILVD